MSPQALASLLIDYAMKNPRSRFVQELHGEKSAHPHEP